MQLTIYSFIVCVGIFLIQLFFITRKNKLVIKILVALIISIIVGVLSFYILYIYVLIGLNAGL